MVDLSQLTAVDQIWADDIIYIAFHKEFPCLMAIMDLQH